MFIRNHQNILNVVILIILFIIGFIFIANYFCPKERKDTFDSLIVKQISTSTSVIIANGNTDSIEIIATSSSKDLIDKNKFKKTVISIGKVEINSFVSDTETLQEAGLSGWSGLEANQGMLFVFPTPGKYNFWMKDMKFALDMIWLNEKKQIIDIAENILPETYPKSFSPSENSIYVLEVPSGFCSQNNIVVGQTAIWKISVTK